MNSKVTLSSLLKYALTLRETDMLYPGLVLKFEVTKEERKSIFDEILKYDIDNWTMSTSDNKPGSKDKNFIAFEIIGIKMEIH